MNRQPIIIAAGEPNSIFLEIFFKSLKLNTYKSPIIIIVSKRLLKEQMRKLGFNIKIINKMVDESIVLKDWESMLSGKDDFINFNNSNFN